MAFRHDERDLVGHDVPARAGHDLVELLGVDLGVGRGVKLVHLFLTGGDEEFGPDFGGATVHTVARKEWVAACPNAAKLFSQLVFDVDMENVLMGNILDDAMDPAEAAKAWIAANPDRVGTWLEGVTTVDGGDALAALNEALDG